MQGEKRMLLQQKKENKTKHGNMFLNQTKVYLNNSRVGILHIIDLRWVNWISLASCGHTKEPEHTEHYSRDVDSVFLVMRKKY